MTESYKDSLSSICLTSYTPNRLTYETNNAQDGIAVFSEIYYPDGWHVTVDGQPAKLARADYILRTMYVPAGQHTIEMRFRPTKPARDGRHRLRSTGPYSRRSPVCPLENKTKETQRRLNKNDKRSDLHRWSALSAPPVAGIITSTIYILKKITIKGQTKDVNNNARDTIRKGSQPPAQ